MFSAKRTRPSTPQLLSGAMCFALAGCQRAPDIGAAAQAGTASSTPATAGASLGIRPDGDTESRIDSFAGKNGPSMKGPDLVAKMKKQLIKNGYPQGLRHGGRRKDLAAVLFNYAGKN